MQTVFSDKNIIIEKNQKQLSFLCFWLAYEGDDEGKQPKKNLFNNFIQMESCRFRH